MSTPNPDQLIVDGKVITTRDQCQEMIELRASERGISHDEAWAVVQKEVLLYLDDGKKTAQPTSTGGAAKGVAHRSDGKGRGGQVLRPGDPDPNEGAHNLIRTNGNEVDLTGGRVPGVEEGEEGNLLDALARGELKLMQEHPDAEILRRTAPQTTGLPPDKAAQLLEDASLAQRLVEQTRAHLQYPLFRSTARVMPNDLLRTSLFHASSNNVPRRYCKNEKLGTIGSGVTIYYQGEELRQTDEAVFRQLITEARGSAPWDWISLSQCQFIKAAKGTGRHMSSEDNSEFKDIIMRLRSGLLLIQSRRRGAFITCNLLTDYEGLGKEQRVRFDPRIVLLFDGYTAIDESILYSLKGISQKIYSYLATIPHSDLYPISVKNMFELCYGRIEYLVKDFRRRNEHKSQKEAEVAVAKKYSDFLRKNLGKALTELQKKKGVILSFEIDYKEEKVEIVKNPDMWAEVKELPLGGST